jgi:amino acid adenylation domain-containing protein
MSQSFKTLGESFCASARRHGQRPALTVAGQELTYQQLHEKAAALAATLQRHTPEGGPLLTAVFAYRSATAFAGVLAALLRGHGYVPLNRTFPADRTATMLQRSGCRAMIVDEASAEQLDAVLAGIETALAIILPESQDVSALASRHPKHKFYGTAQLASHNDLAPAEARPEQIAYVLFTSGSTGQPKGVMVSQANVRHYVDFIANRFQITEADRFSQTFDMTFDLSASDMFVAWERGACLCCPSMKTLLNPAKFIGESGLTFWFSVPSTGVFMKKLGTLKPGNFPKLRVSMFCGEALPVEVARAWAEAAPNSIVENIYGPTELTIACTYYRWDPVKSPGESPFGIVPIGDPFPRMKVFVANEELKEVEPGGEGELLMTGPQRSLGYLNDAAKTAAAFVQPPDRDQVYYRTGDRVRRPKPGEPLIYLGRMDYQLKILGHRVELGEIEAVIRAASGVDGVVAVGWPVNASGADGIEVFLQTESVDAAALQEKVKSKLPVYMQPRHYRALARFPLNSNGKFDRKALLDILQTPK